MINKTKTIPKGWKKVKLGDFIDFRNGYAFNSKKYTSSGKIIIRMSNISVNGELNVNDSNIKYTDERTFRELSDYQLKKNDLVMCMTDVSKEFGVVGKTAIIDKNDTYILNQRVGRIRPNKELDVRFLHYFTNSEYFLNDIYQKVTGSAQYNLSTADIKQSKILLPPLQEQIKIVGILLSIDERINNTEKIIAKTEELKIGLMQELLIKGIRGGHSHYKKTKLGQIPVEWEVVKIQNSGIDLIDGDRGINYPKQDEFYIKEYCLFLSNKNIKDDKFVFEECAFITKEKDELLRKGKLQRNDIVLTTRGTVGNVAYYDDSVPFENIRINSGMLILRHGKKFDPLFLYKLLSSQIMKQKYKDMGSGSAQPQLPIGSLKNINMPLIPLDEQKKIAKIIFDVDFKIDVNKQIKNKLAELKSGLMQDLLSGRARVI